MKTQTQPKHQPSRTVGPRTLRNRLDRLADLQAQIKNLYDARDKIEAEIREMLAVGEAVDYGDGQEAVHVDNFAEKNVQFGHGPVRRFEIVIRKKKVAKQAKPKPTAKAGPLRRKSA